MINKLENIINNLDGVAGRLLVASMSNSTVREAMEMLSTVSIELGELAEEIEMLNIKQDFYKNKLK